MYRKKRASPGALSFFYPIFVPYQKGMNVLKRLVYFSFASLSPIFVQAQITASLSQVNTCPGPFPTDINVEQFTAVASVSLKLNYDTSVLVFDSSSNLHPSLGSGVFLINAVNGQVILSWFSLQPASIGTGTLIRLHFRHRINENTLLTWLDDSLGNCVFTDLNGTELPAVFQDGSVSTKLLPPQPLNPPDLAVNITENPNLHWNGSNCAPLYELAYDSLPSMATATHIPGIFGTSHTLSNLALNTTYYWKVRAIIPQSSFSSPWSVLFRFTTRLPNSVDGVEGNSLTNMVLRPNPAKDQAWLAFDVSSRIDAEILLSDQQGKQLQIIQKDTLEPGKHNLYIDLSTIAAGIYLIKAGWEQSGHLKTQIIQLVVSK